MTMERCSDLTELSRHFYEKISQLQLCVYLNQAKEDPDCAATLQTVEHAIGTLEEHLAQMRAELQRQQTAVEEYKTLKKEVTKLNEHAKYVLHHMPQRFAKAQTANPRPTYESPSLTSEMRNSDHSSAQTGTPVACLQQLRKSGRALFIPTLDYIRSEDFEMVPKYMKGRIKYEKVNAVIDDFNKAVAAKYRIMQIGKSKKVGESVKKHYQKLKAQENKDTTGMHFITDKDMLDLAGVKLDPALRSVLTILRHCGLVKEIRGQGIVRYAVLV